MINYSGMTNETLVKKQYSNDSGLNIRKALHHKYSSNKLGFGVWLHEQYDLMPGMRILELGSGNGDFWEPKITDLCKQVEITLSDFSEGMVRILSDKYNKLSVKVKQIDVQDIPFGDDTFDVVIANAMLYHVPNLEMAISEIHRILKPGGTFYGSTFGENGLTSFINKALEQLEVSGNESLNLSFTLQNGQESLEKVFAQVNRVDYVDSLQITKVDDLVDYIYSMTSITGLDEGKRIELTRVLKTRQDDNGIINIPKEYGTFIAKKRD